jgi:hypothetical protein
MGFMRRTLPVATGLLLLGACSDLPTAPPTSPTDLDGTAAGSFDSAEGCVSDGFCVLEPIVVGPGDCDPAYEDCSGDNCLESNTRDPDAAGAESCPGWGGPGDEGPGDEGPGGGGSGDPGDGGGDDPSQPSCPEGDLSCETQPDPCDTGDPIVDSPEVHDLFAEVWSQSVEQKVEKGGWIVQQGSSYQLIPFQNASFTACAITIYESPPPGTVSMLHTHPWQLFSAYECDGNTYFYSGTPSEDDVRVLQELGYSTGYFLDEVGVARYDPDNGEKAERLDRCAY